MATTEGEEDAATATKETVGEFWSTRGESDIPSPTYKGVCKDFPSSEKGTNTQTHMYTFPHTHACMCKHIYTESGVRHVHVVDPW